MQILKTAFSCNVFKDTVCIFYCRYYIPSEWFTLSRRNYNLVCFSLHARKTMNEIYIFLCECIYRRPISNVPSGGTVQIQITQRYSWNRNVIPCDGTTIAGLGLIGDYSSVTCVTGSCPVSFGLTSDTYCTDYSVDSIVSSGEKSNVVTINVGTSFSVGYISGAWFGNLVVGANGAWNIVNLISTVIRPDNYINTSPVATTLPVIYKQVNIQHVHVVQMADFDSTDVLKCRWSIGSTSNINGYNECGSVCSGVPGAALYTNNCTIVFTLTVAASYAAVALQIEDYYSVSSSSPMSSVPLQFLFYGYVAPSGCSTPSTIIGVRPNRGKIVMTHF